MSDPVETLAGMRVADAMSRDAVTVSMNQTLADATAALSAQGLSGAPVVDEMGRCVGMLTGSNIVHSQAAAGERPAGSGPQEGRLIHENAESPYHIEALPSDLVSQHMTPAVQTIAETASLAAASRIMCVEEIHRLPVLDGAGRVAGVLTALDILRTILKSACDK